MLGLYKSLVKPHILTGNDVTESIYFNVAMGWQVPIHRSPVVSLRPNMEYCSQAWAPMARHGNWSLILELEGVQRSFTRMIDGLGLMTYRERLDKLNLTTLLERRVRGDLIEMFKIQEGFVGYGSDLFGRSGRTVAARSKTHRFTTNETDFFAQRVLRYWNSLPPLVKASESVIGFKSRLDAFRLSGY